MAFDTQVVVFDLIAYAGLAFAVPASDNPSGYDVIALSVEETAAASADSSVSTIAARSTNWAVVAGLTSVLNFGAGQGADMLSNGAGAALGADNGGNITPAGAWAALFIATPGNVRVTATLQRASGGGQGSR